MLSPSSVKIGAVEVGLEEERVVESDSLKIAFIEMSLQ